MFKYRESIANTLLKERKVNIVSEIPERIKCIICKNIIVNARQSPCGCRYCCDCIINYLNGEMKFCPGSTGECNDEILNIKENVINDFGTDREIRRLRFKCQNEGCNHEDEISLLDEHIKLCLYAKEECPLCNEIFIRIDLEGHVANDCINRFITCQYCGIKIVAKSMEAEHTNIESDKLCSHFVSICPLNCDIKDPIVVSQHRLVCANRPRNCPYDIVGCPAKGYTKKALNGHIIDHIFDHSKILFDSLSRYKEEVNAIKKRLSYLEENFLTFVWKIERFSKSFEPSKNSRLTKTFSLGNFSYNAAIDLTVSEGFVQVFFSIVKGEFDDILKWPFDRKVTITIVDQSGNDKHYSKILKTSHDPECFGKPGSQRKGFGFDQYIDMEVLRLSEHLLVKDQIFLKCSVHP